MSSKKSLFTIPSSDVLDAEVKDSYQVSSLFKAHKSSSKSSTNENPAASKENVMKTAYVEQAAPQLITSDKVVAPNPITNKIEAPGIDIIGEESEALTSVSTKPKPPKNSNAVLINSRQRGNPIIKYIRNVPYEYSDIVPDYQMGRTTCALYLSLRYHHLNPEYIHGRIKELGRLFDLRVLLVQVDVKDPHHSLKELARMCLMINFTLILAFNTEEAGRYIETYKIYENKPPDLIMEKLETNYLGQVTDTLTSVKSVNKTDAIHLLSEFKDVKSVIQASDEDLLGCPGLGPLKAKRLYNVFHTPFLKSKHSPKKKS